MTENENLERHKEQMAECRMLFNARWLADHPFGFPTADYITAWKAHPKPKYSPLTNVPSSENVHGMSKYAINTERIKELLDTPEHGENIKTLIRDSLSNLRIVGIIVKTDEPEPTAEKQPEQTA